MRYAINKIGAGEPKSAIFVCRFMQQIHEGQTIFELMLLVLLNDYLPVVYMLFLCC